MQPTGGNATLIGLAIRYIVNGMSSFLVQPAVLDGNMNTSGRDRGIRQGTVAMKSSRRQQSPQGQWIWTESSESSD
jgi:hypothetical protein